MAGSFYIPKTLMKPWEYVDADGLCIDGNVLESSNSWVVVISNNHRINAVWVGKSVISPGTTVCENSITVIVTDDWKEPFMDFDDYTQIQTYEMLFIGFFFFVLFLIKLTKNVW